MELGFNLSCQRIPPSFRQQDKKSPGQPLRQRKGSRTAAPLLLTTHPLLRPTTPKPVTRPGPVLSLTAAGRPAFWLVDWPIGDKPVRVTSDGFPTAPGATHASQPGAPHHPCQRLSLQLLKPPRHCDSHLTWTQRQASPTSMVAPVHNSRRTMAARRCKCGRGIDFSQTDLRWKPDNL